MLFVSTAQARASAPCLLFFDELDAIASKRDMVSTTSGTASVRAAKLW